MPPVVCDHVQRVHDVLRRTRRNPLNALFSPRSIAVIGATEAGSSVGRSVMENLALFKGRVFPVNPKRTLILGQRAFPSIAALPEIPELAVIATPALTVPGIIRECVDKGVRSAVILSAGFRECGPEGAELEKQIVLEASRGFLRFLGPNCLGLMVPRVSLNATFARNLAAPGSVAFLSQSGALCTAILDWSLEEKVGFSAFVSIGSMADVGWGDLIDHFGDDPETKSIICYMESVGNVRSFLSAAREVALSKPIIVLKVGHTEAAAKAAASHTGALTGSDAVLDAAFRRAGVLRVNTLGELFDMAEVLSRQPRPQGRRLTIVTNAGGPGALATDMIVSNGGRITSLKSETIEALNAFLPPHWSHSNPIDLLGDADAVRYGKALSCAAKDPETDGILTILTPQSMTDATGTATELSRWAKQTEKPILASWMGGVSVAAGRSILNAAEIPTFDTPDTAARAFALMWQYSDNLRALYETPVLGSPDPETGGDRIQAKKLIELAHKKGRTLLTEVESKRILRAYGIPTVDTRVALSEEDAVQSAGEVGFPVAVKLLSETITHKSDVGGVFLDVRNPNAVRHAWNKIKQDVTDLCGSQHFLGVTVQPMIERNGLELILGSSIDPQFGPVLMFGSGGHLVEVFKDTVLGFPPLNDTLARRLIERTRIYTALKGVRGDKPVDLPALERLMVRFSELVAEQRWIAEIDINPLLVSSKQMLALDARIVLHSPDTLEHQLPRLAIKPYPGHYATPWKLKDGTPVKIRPIRPEDEPLMVRFHHTLSDRSVYLRYFSPMTLEQRVNHERLSRICFIDYDREMALIVERHNAESNQPEIVGVGRLTRLHGVNEAEFALVVSDGWQGKGIGSQLLKRLVQVGHDEKLARITAIILADNHEMQHIARKEGFEVHQIPGGGEFQAEIRLPDSAVAPTESDPEDRFAAAN